MATASTTDATSSTEVKSADQLRDEMRKIRRELGRDVEELVEHAERLMDWRYYVRQHPWAVLGVAAFLGYFLVPRRNVTLPTDEHTLSRLAEKIHVAPQKPETKRPGLIDGALSIGTNLLMRAVMAYVGQQVGKVLGHKTAEVQETEAR